MNKVFLIGNLTRDPETKTVGSGITVCTFTLAVNRRVKKDGEQGCDYLNVTAWRQLGELCAKYLAKGRKCSVVGSIQVRSYEAKDGSKRTAWDIVADEVEFLSPVGAVSGQKASGSAPDGAYVTAVSKRAESDSGASGGFTQVEDEELPF